MKMATANCKGMHTNTSLMMIFFSHLPGGSGVKITLQGMKHWNMM
jgi:hypothetical protein